MPVILWNAGDIKQRFKLDNVQYNALRRAVEAHFSKHKVDIILPRKPQEGYDPDVIYKNRAKFEKALPSFDCASYTKLQKFSEKDEVIRSIARHMGSARRQLKSKNAKRQKLLAAEDEDSESEDEKKDEKKEKQKKKQKKKEKSKDTTDANNTDAMDIDTTGDAPASDLDHDEEVKKLKKKH